MDKFTAQGVKNYFREVGESVFTKKTLEKRVPILKWGRSYDMECLQGDVLAGFTVGLTVIPQGIAYAVVAGVDPIFGLYSSFMGCFVYMIFGSSKDITIGPTAIMALLTHQYCQSLPCHDDLAALSNMAVLLAFLTGCVIMIATVFRIGFLITFIGRTVISGFTSAAAISIATTQIKGMLGISIEAEGFVATWRETFKHIGETRWQDLTLCLCCIVVLLYMRSMRNFERVKPKPDDNLTAKVWKKMVFLASVGRNAIVVIIGCCIAYALRDDQPFRIQGPITAGFPHVQPPPFSLTCNSTNNTETYNFGDIAGFFSTGIFIVPLIGIIENIAIASAFAHGKAIDATQEMLALSLCNFAGSFFQSIPTTGSFSRTAVNATSGVKTQAGGLTTGILVILALVFLTPAFKYIPKAALAAVIICAVIFMIEYHDIMPVWRAYKWDQIPLWATFLMCLFWALEWGILVGVAINIGMLLYTQARPRITVSMRKFDDANLENVVVVEPALGLMFPSADHVKATVSKVGLEHAPLLVVLDCSHVALVDYTAAVVIQNLCKEFDSRNQRVAFANMSSRVKTSLQSLTPKLQEVVLPSTLVQIENGATSNSFSPAPLISIGSSLMASAVTEAAPLTQSPRPAPPSLASVTVESVRNHTAAPLVKMEDVLPEPTDALLPSKAETVIAVEDQVEPLTDELKPADQATKAGENITEPSEGRAGPSDLPAEPSDLSRSLTDQATNLGEPPAIQLDDTTKASDNSGESLIDPTKTQEESVKPSEAYPSTVAAYGEFDEGADDPLLGDDTSAQKITVLPKF